jgi:hypothetical protein
LSFEATTASTIRSAASLSCAVLSSASVSFGKHEPPVAGTWLKEARADAGVEADAAGDVVHVGADLLAQVGDLVDETNLGREEGVGGVLGQLGGAALHDQQRRLVAQQRAVNLVQHGLGVLVVDPDHHPVGPLEVLDRRAFAQELGIRGDREGEIGARLADNPFDLVAGADRHGRLGHLPPRPARGAPPSRARRRGRSSGRHARRRGATGCRRR